MTTIGASEAAVVLGLQRRHLDGEPYVSSLELWARLTGALPRYDSAPSSPDAEIGRWVEIAIGHRYAVLHDLTPGTGIAPGPSLDQPPLTHASIPHVHARPDYLVPALERVLEVKAPRSLDPDRWGPDGSDEVPPEYAVQVLVQVAIAHRLWGVGCGDLAAMARAPGWGDRRVWAVYHLRRDAGREVRVLDAIARWVDRHVVGGEPPAPDGSESALHAIRRMYGVLDEDRARAATPTDLEHLRRIVGCRTAMEEIRGRLEESRQRLAVAMGEATELHHDGHLVATWRPNKHGVRSLRIRHDVHHDSTTEAA